MTLNEQDNKWDKLHKSFILIDFGYGLKKNFINPTHMMCQEKAKQLCGSRNLSLKKKKN